MPPTPTPHTSFSCAFLTLDEVGKYVKFACRAPHLAARSRFPASPQAPKPLCSCFIFSLPQTWASSGHGACRGPSLSSVAHGCYLLLSIRSYEDKQLKGSDRGWLETTLFMSHPSLGHSSALQLLDYGKEVSFKVGPS